MHYHIEIREIGARNGGPEREAIVHHKADAEWIAAALNLDMDMKAVLRRATVVPCHDAACRWDTSPSP